MRHTRVFIENGNIKEDVLSRGTVRSTCRHRCVTDAERPEPTTLDRHTWCLSKHKNGSYQTRMSMDGRLSEVVGGTSGPVVKMTTTPTFVEGL